MSQQRTYQGHTYEQSAPGQPWVLVGPATPQAVTIGTPNPSAAPKNAADASKAATDAQVAAATAPYAGTKAAAEARSAVAAANKAETDASSAAEQQASKEQTATESTRQLIDGLERARGLVNGWSTGAVGRMGQIMPGATDANKLETVINQQVRGSIFKNWVADMKAQTTTGTSGIGRIMQSEIPLVTGSLGALDPVHMGRQGTLDSIDEIEKNVLRAQALRNGDNPDDPKVATHYRTMFGLPPLGGTTTPPSSGSGTGGNGGPPITPWDNGSGGQTVATGTTRKVFDPTTSAGLDALVQIGRPYEEAAAYAQSRGFPPPKPNEYAAALAWQKAHPNASYNASSATRTEPVSLPQQVVDSPLAAFGAHAVNSFDAGVPGLLLPGAQNTLDEMGNYSPLASVGGDIFGNIGGMTTAAKLAGKAAARVAAPSIAKILANPVTADSVFGATYGASQDPRDPLLGAVIGAGTSAAGSVAGAQVARNLPGIVGMGGAIKDAKDAVPSIPALKQQASDLYDAAETNGIAAGPAETQGLADTFGKTLASEGRISPTGRLSDVNPKVKEAYQLVTDYAGSPMTPSQMQTVRSVTADGLSSPDRSERRISRLLLDNFDDWADNKVPGIQDARDTASRYLKAEQVQRAIDLAQPQASQFSGSGMENALRTQFRTLDRDAIRGRNNFDDPLLAAVENVSRGSPASNTARAFGKLAPTGVVSAGMSAGVPFAIGNAVGGPALGGALAAGSMAIGAGARKAATSMAMRDAEIASLLARDPSFGDTLNSLVDQAAARGAPFVAGTAAPLALIPVEG